MSFTNKKSVRKSGKRLTPIQVAAVVVVLAIVILGVLEATNATHLFHKQSALLQKDNGSSSASSSNKAGGNASKSSGSSGAVSGGPSSSSGQGIHQTAATDTNGKTSAGTSPSQWTTSASGMITLKSPVAGSTFKSGGTISGTAKVSKVWYRLVDNSVGQIAYGNLAVVGGKFSGTLNFRHYANSGQLDVYSFSGSGAETNEVRINLNF